MRRRRGGSVLVSGAQWVADDEGGSISVFKSIRH